MIPKLVLSGSYDFGEAATSLVPLHSRGVDSNWMIKQASSGLFAKDIANLKPNKDETVIHVIALGDEESMGANRNCDAFSKDDNKAKHHTFVDLGHVFKNHDNRDPKKSVGRVIASGHNDLMGRVELLLGLNNNKCRDEVQKLAEGKDVPLSMGSMQDHDVCSYCKHAAPTADDHCDHIKNMLGEVLADGTRVYMKNPNPKFFDISIVHKPADRIAYTLRKVASAQSIGGHELADAFGIRAWNNPKQATITALASMCKEVPLTVKGIAAPKNLSQESKAELKKIAQAYGLEQLFGFLVKNAFVLSPYDFAEIIGHESPSGCEKAAMEHDGLADVVNDDTEVTSFDSEACPHCGRLSDDVKHELHESCSLDPDAVRKRSLSIIVVGKPKTAGLGLPEAEAKGFSALYAHYKIAVAHCHSNSRYVLSTLASTF